MVWTVNNDSISLILGVGSLISSALSEILLSLFLLQLCKLLWKGSSNYFIASFDYDYQLYYYLFLHLF